MDEILGIMVISAFAITCLWFLYLLLRQIYYGLKVYYTNPFRGKEHPFVYGDCWSDIYYGYHFIDGIWYKGHAEKDWEEAKFSEPVNTLLTLIHQDFENFTFSITKTEHGGTRYLTMEHNTLDIGGSLDLYETGNYLNMFGQQIHIKKDECGVIKDFFVSIDYRNKENTKNLEIKRLQAEREAYKEYVVEGIQEYLINKENK